MKRLRGLQLVITALTVRLRRRTPVKRGGERGAVAIIFALSLIPLLAGAGVAIDFLRAATARAVLQSAVDAAVLAVGANNDFNEGVALPLVQNYLAANPVGQTITITPPVVDVDEEARTVRLTVRATVPTGLMALVGINTVEIAAAAGAERASTGPLDLVLVLDTTASMVPGNKLITMKTAAVNLVNEVLQYNSSAAPSRVRVGIVPFATYINVGLSNAGANWLIVPPDETITTRTYPNRTGCSIQPTFCDGLPCMGTVCTSMGAPVCAPEATPRSWTGCMGSRAAALRAVVSGAEVNRYPGVITRSVDPINQCASPILPPISDQAVLTTAINGLIAIGETFIPQGILWGWNALTPEEPIIGARTDAQMAATGGRKVMVLMTDGANSISPTNAAAGRHTTHSNSFYLNGNYTNQLTRDLCTNVKAAGIHIYTVAFAVSDAEILSILQGCASDAESFFTAENNGALIATFQEIGAKLTSLRLIN